MKYAPWIKFEQMKKKLLLRWLRCVSFHCESALEGAQRFKRGGHKSIYIPYWRKTCEPDQQPANFIASPTFQNFPQANFSTFCSSSPRKWPVGGPNESVLRKCLWSWHFFDVSVGGGVRESICNTLGDAIGISLQVHQSRNRADSMTILVRFVNNFFQRPRVGSLIYGVCFRFFLAAVFVLAFLFVPSNCTSHKQL